MRLKERNSEIFWLAFKGLSRDEQRKVIERLLADRDFMEELKAIALIELRREEPSRPIEFTEGNPTERNKNNASFPY